MTSIIRLFGFPYIVFVSLFIANHFINFGPNIEALLDWVLLIGSSFIFLIHKTFRKRNWIFIAGISAANIFIFLITAFEIMKIIFDESL